MDDEKPSIGKVILVGLIFIVVILSIIAHDMIRTNIDKKDFCINKTKTIKYPICERNEWKSCHGKSNITLLLDCSQYGQ